MGLQMYFTFLLQLPGFIPPLPKIAWKLTLLL